MLTFATIDDFLAFWIDGPGNGALDPDMRASLATYYGNYQGKFNSYVRGHYRSQVEEAEGIISRLNAPSLLEVGCGLGTESLWFGILGARVLGLDINAPRLRVANARRDWVKSNIAPDLRVEFQQRSVLDVDHEPFDVIWMEQALHHLEPRAAVMEKLASLLKPGGYLIASEANALNPMMQLKLFMERGFNTIGTTVDSAGKTHLYGNERVLSVGALRRAAERVGIRRIAHRYFRCFPARNWVRRVAWVETICPQWLAFAFTHYNFVGMKSEPNPHERS